MQTVTIVLNGIQAADLTELLSESDIEGDDDVLTPLFEGLLTLSVDLAPEGKNLTLDISI